MKNPEHFPSDDPREWLNRARSNLAIAKTRVPQAYLEAIAIAETVVRWTEEML